jgi:hypothetical protein
MELQRIHSGRSLLVFKTGDIEVNGIMIKTVKWTFVLL